MVFEVGFVETHGLVEVVGKKDAGQVEIDGVDDVGVGCCGVEAVAGSSQMVGCWDAAEKVDGGVGCGDVVDIGQVGVHGVAEMPDADGSFEVVVVEVVAGTVDVVEMFDAESCGELMGVNQVPVVG